MARVIIQRAEPGAEPVRGQWQAPKNPRFPYMTVACPGCGVPLTLGRAHTIEPNGDVNPSFWDLPPRGCGFHEWVTLEGWPP